MLVTTTMQAGAAGAQQYTERNDFFRLMEATGPVHVIFYDAGREVARSNSVKAGYAERFAQGFDSWRIESPTAQTIQFVTRLGNSVDYDIAPTGVVSGTVNVGNFPGTQPVSGTVNVGNFPGTQPVSGTVNVGNLPSVSSLFTQAGATVTNTSGQLLAARATRRYLMIQNRNTSGFIYVNLTGATATVANGIELGPGESYELSTFCPTAAITAIGSIASNPNVLVVEG
jgi:hypothetical protein